MKETDLAERVVAYLRDLHYEVHQEAGADIVGIMNGHAWAIECKLGLGLGVLAQAMNLVNHRAAAFVSVATPPLIPLPSQMWKRGRKPRDTPLSRKKTCTVSRRSRDQR